MPDHDQPKSTNDAPSEPIRGARTPSGWPPRDILAPFVLLAVSLQRAHGYVIEDYLQTLGIFGITMSTLYRTLRQMEKDGFLELTWEPGPTGPARRVYTITDAGNAWLDSSASMLQRISRDDRPVLRPVRGRGAIRPQPTTERAEGGARMTKTQDQTEAGDPYETWRQLYDANERPGPRPSRRR